jgi:putative glutamine amidotransferase
MKPIIGISATAIRSEGERYSRLNENYTRSVRAAGGLPLILPFDLTQSDAEAIVALIDGIVFSGGGDVDPRYFGEDPHPALKRVSAAYDASEMALFKAAEQARLPVLGICRGCQLINVAMGGSLFQDIPAQLPGAIAHYPAGAPMDESFHRIDIVDSASIMARCFGLEELYVNSFHHQAVRKLAAGLRVTAKSGDGVIEAFEGSDGAWFLHALQFHPEGLTKPGTPRYADFQKLFGSFVDAAGLRKPRTR